METFPFVGTNHIRFKGYFSVKINLNTPKVQCVKGIDYLGMNPNERDLYSVNRRLARFIDEQWVQV